MHVTPDHRRRGTAARLWATLVLVAVMVLGGGATPASAHTELVASTPRAGDVVAPGLDHVELVFLEELVPEASAVVVRDASGHEVGHGPPVVTGTTLVVPVEGLTSGTHDVSYRVTSVDGHPVVGSFSFTVAAPGGALRGTAREERSASVGAAAQAGTPPTAGGWLLAGALLVGLVGLVVALRRARGGRAPDRVSTGPG